MLKIIPAIASLLLVAGCSSMEIDNPGSDYYRPPAGSLVHLNQALTVPAQQTRVFIQHGKVVNGVDLYAPHCNFEVRTLKPTPRQIEPGTFAVTRVQPGGEQVVMQGGCSQDELEQNPAEAGSKCGAPGFHPVLSGSLTGRQVAGLPWHVLSDPPVITRFYHFYLASKAQPDVLRLTCHAAQDDAPRAQLPTFGEMQEALGGVATFEPAH